MEEYSAPNVQILPYRPGCAATAPVWRSQDERASAHGSSVPSSLWLGVVLTTAYVIFYELYTQATSRLAVKAPSIAVDLATFASYLAPVLVIQNQMPVSQARRESVEMRSGFAWSGSTR